MENMRGKRRDGKSKGKGWEGHSLVMANHTSITMAGLHQTCGQDSPQEAKHFHFSPGTTTTPLGSKWSQMVSNGLKWPLEFVLGQKTPDSKSCMASFFSFPHPSIKPRTPYLFVGPPHLPAHLKLQTKSLNLGLSLGS